MSDEEKKPEIQDNVPDPSEETPEEGEKTEEQSAQDSEYEAKLTSLEEEKTKADEERSNLQKALTEARTKLKEAKEQQQEGETPPAVDYDELKKIVEEAAESKVNRLRVDMGVETFNQELEHLTANTKEKELIKEHYQHSIRPSGVDRESIRRDLLLCKAAANLNHLRFGNQPDFDPAITTALGATGGSSQKMEARNNNLTEEEKHFAKVYGVDEKEAAKAKDK